MDHVFQAPITEDERAVLALAWASPPTLRGVASVAEGAWGIIAGRSRTPEECPSPIEVGWGFGIRDMILDIAREEPTAGVLGVTCAHGVSVDSCRRRCATKASLEGLEMM